ncbi:hypothetical protein RJT34_08811 [Clitoria ternatea]|uniref:BZIP domain-containing protein n=1 Tax=Clitoria ternatea TaxID=43366 RepID=A0AAN9PUU7_CLITE
MAPCPSNKQTFMESESKSPSTPSPSPSFHQFLPIPFHKHSTTPPPPPQPCHTFQLCPSKRDPCCDSSDSDQRFKRLIKNRDSAARSRARKQENIYTNSSL